MSLQRIVPLLTLLILVPVLAIAAVPREFGYQGVLRTVDGSPVADGDYLVTFRLYAAEDDDGEIWAESQTVTTSGGLFDAILGGSVTLDLPFDQAYWLGIEISGEGELLPRSQLTALPFALRAAVSDSIAGGIAADDDWTFAGDDIYRIAGRVGIGVTPGPAPASSRVAAGGATPLPRPVSDKLRVKGTNEGLFVELSETDSASDQRAAVYGMRKRSLRNDGTGFGVGVTNNAVTGYNEWGDSYTFGVAGYTWHDYPHTAGVLGASWDGQNWAALSYVDTDSETWSLYTNNRARIGGDLVTLGLQLPTGASAGYVLTSDAVGAASWQPASGGADGDWVVNGSDMYAGVAGNVGIGLDVPNRKLYVVDDTPGIGFALKLDNPHPTYNEDGVGILFSVGGSGGGPLSPTRGKGGLVYEYRNTWNRGCFHILQEPNAGEANPDLTHAVMSIDNGGRVGIGTRYPNGPLHIESSLNLNSGDNFTNRIAPLSVGNADGSDATLLLDGNQIEVTGGGTSLYLNYNSPAGIAMVYGGGNVGIGTHAPVERLQVEGVIYSTSGGIKFPDGTVQTTAGEGEGGGLVLPYSAPWDGTGDAFSITHTGNGSAAFFGGTANYGKTLQASASGTNGSGGDFQSHGDGGRGVIAHAYGTGANHGGVFSTDGHTGRGVWGLAVASGAVTNFGGYFEAYGNTGHAVHAVAQAEGAVANVGGHFEARGDNGVGIHAEAGDTQSIGTPIGGSFEARAKDGVAVRAVAGSSSSGDVASVSLQGWNDYGKAVEGVALHGYGGFFVGMGYFSQSVGIGTEIPSAKLDVAGDIKCDILRITAGGDIAEPFNVRESEPVAPGMLLSIDAEQPGKLRLSGEAYDRCVAGIVSGAGGVSPGVLMGQTGTAADGEIPVAMTGRVYCWADAEAGEIRPGDLLTTSPRVGHAMRVDDHARAQGATIGKAMSGLDEGQGLVLVLVALQ